MWVELEKNLLRIHVTDDGAGICPSRLQNIFEPYETTREEQGGTGLGLAAVRRIAEAAGGCVRVLSTPGAGTDMIVELPAVENADAASEVRLRLSVPAGAKVPRAAGDTT